MAAETSLSLPLIVNDESHVHSSQALTDMMSIITTETDPMMSPSWPCLTADGHQRQSWFFPPLSDWLDYSAAVLMTVVQNGCNLIMAKNTGFIPLARAFSILGLFVPAYFVMFVPFVVQCFSLYSFFYFNFNWMASHVFILLKYIFWFLFVHSTRLWVLQE